MNKPVLTLHRRTMKRIFTSGAITHVKGLTLDQVDLEKLRIVIAESLDVAFRMGYRLGASR